MTDSWQTSPSQDHPPHLPAVPSTLGMLVTTKGESPWAQGMWLQEPGCGWLWSCPPWASLASLYG